MNSYGIALIKNAEKCVLHPYLDSGNKPTIGWGNTFYEDGTRVKMTDKHLSQKRANQLFDNISQAFYRDVKKLVIVDTNENKLSALSSIAYNIGISAFKSSSLLKLVNSNANQDIIDLHFREWNKDNGKVERGLIARREKEIELYKKKILNSKFMEKIKKFVTANKTAVMIVSGVVLIVVLYKKFKK